MAEKKSVKKRFFTKKEETEPVGIIVSDPVKELSQEPVVKIIKPQIQVPKVELPVIEPPAKVIPVIEKKIEPTVVETPVIEPPIAKKFKLVRITKTGISFREEVIMVGNYQDCLIAEDDYRKRYTADIYRLLIKRSR